MLGYRNEAEGYAASLRQQAKWMRELPSAIVENLDPDELDAAADFIERQQKAGNGVTTVTPHSGYWLVTLPCGEIRRHSFTITMVEFLRIHPDCTVRWIAD